MDPLIVKNFHWKDTKRPLVIFIPNYGRGNYIRDTISQFNTQADKNDYMIIIGNDGIDEDFSDLEDQNVRHFTLLRDNPESVRNGCFIRNYYFKRSLSFQTLQKDPETEIVSGEDWIQKLINKKLSTKLWRPSLTYDVDMHGEEVQQTVQIGSPYRMHWGFSCLTSAIQNINGYDQRFTKYGWEDIDMYDRLINGLGIQVDYDDKVSVKHHWHPIDDRVYEDVNEMSVVYAETRSSKPVRNLDTIWGEG